MSEQSKIDEERARVVDAMCMTWRHDFGLDSKDDELGSCGMTDTERDALRRQMGQLYDHHFAARSLPVGVPDEALVPSPSSCGDAWTNNKPDREGAYWIRGNGLEQPALIQVKMGPDELECNLHMSTTEPNFGYGYTISQLNDDFEWLGPLTTAAPTVKDSLSVAPTVKAEQSRIVMPDRKPVRMPEGRNLPRGYAEAWNAALDEVTRLNPAPSLPAAGSAVEYDRSRFESEFQKQHPNVPLERYDADTYPAAEYKIGWVHEQYVGWQMARALSAQQSAPERVSVPVELARKLVRTYEDAIIDAAHWTDMDGEVTQLRALLASHGRVSVPDLASVEVKCQRCHGNGFIGEEPMECPSCDGKGVK